jgi:hypothetical protein
MYEWQIDSLCQGQANVPSETYQTRQVVPVKSPALTLNSTTISRISVRGGTVSTLHWTFDLLTNDISPSESKQPHVPP